MRIDATRYDLRVMKKILIFLFFFLFFFSLCNTSGGEEPEGEWGEDRWQKGYENDQLNLWMVVFFLIIILIIGVIIGFFWGKNKCS